MDIVIIGICGKMGSLIYEYFKKTYTIYGIDKKNHYEAKMYENINEIKNVGFIIDFSSNDCFCLLEQAVKNKIPVFSGTTGYSFEQIEYLKDLSYKNKSIFVWKPNYAKGINLFSKILKDCKKDFKSLDFIEIHETTKRDAPSGTAILLANILGVDVSAIQSIRLKYAPATHEIIFYSDSERITFRHEIFDKKAFIIGLLEDIKKSGVDENVRNII